MSSQLYISPLTQNSKGQWRPAITNSGAWDAEPNPAIHVVQAPIVSGQPVIPWCLAAVFALDHEALAAVEGVFQLPDYPLSGAMNDLDQAVKAALLVELLARGVDMGAVNNADLFRDVVVIVAVNTLGRTEGFSPEQFLTF